jgi:hypothetical protein
MILSETEFFKLPPHLRELFALMPNPNADEVEAGFPASSGGHWSYKYPEDGAIYKHGLKNLADAGTDKEKGSASRFFYCAKTNIKDRDLGCDHLPLHQGGLQLPRGKCPDCGTWKNAGEERCKCGGEWETKSNPPPKARNNHPTVKPTDLMRYLVKLVTPKGGVCLDPFMGSGSTGKACMYEGFNFIGIEQDAQYVEIARARIDYAMRNPLTQVEAPEKNERVAAAPVDLPAKKKRGRPPKTPSPQIRLI